MSDKKIERMEGQQRAQALPHLQVYSTIIARRNAAIFDYNAWPKMGGEMPRAPRVHTSRDGRGRKGAN